MISRGRLHFAILEFIIARGFAPDVAWLAAHFSATPEEVGASLQDLQDYHGVVLHPNKREIWAIHPFSLAPTGFLVRSGDQEWWGNCAWCSLGIAALLKRDATITTRIGAHDEQVSIEIRNGALVSEELFVHFPIPMSKAWDNVIYTCSTMLVFRSRDQVSAWSARHNIPEGDVQPIANIWEFAKVWYGNHLDPEWRKWTTREATDIFRKFQLTGKIWELEVSDGRF